MVTKHAKFSMMLAGILFSGQGMAESITINCESGSPLGGAGPTVSIAWSKDKGTARLSPKGRAYPITRFEPGKKDTYLEADDGKGGKIVFIYEIKRVDAGDPGVSTGYVIVNTDNRHNVAYNGCTQTRASGSIESLSRKASPRPTDLDEEIDHPDSGTGPAR